MDCQCSKCLHRWFIYWGGSIPCPECGEKLILFAHWGMLRHTETYQPLIETHQILIDVETGKRIGNDPCDLIDWSKAMI